jgi:hypothetical protein
MDRAVEQCAGSRRGCDDELEWALEHGACLDQPSAGEPVDTDRRLSQEWRSAWGRLGARRGGVPAWLGEPLGLEEATNEAEQLLRLKRLREEVPVREDKPAADQVFRGECGHQDNG